LGNRPSENKSLHFPVSRPVSPWLITRVVFLRLLILFITVPAVELLLLIRIGTKIGILPTVAIILITGFLGATLTRIQGLKTLSKYQKALAEGRLPHEEVMDGLMILVAGAVLLTPGFLTDIAGFLLLVPAFRTVVRKNLAGYLKTRIHVVGPGGMPINPEAPTPPGASGGERVVKGRIIEEDRES